MTRILIDLLSAVKLAEHSITLLLEDLDELRRQRQEDHDAITRLQEQVAALRQADADVRATGVHERTAGVQARATVTAAAIGATAGLLSLLWQILHR